MRQTGKLITSYSEVSSGYKALPLLSMLYVCIMLITIATAYKLVSFGGISVVASTLILPLWLFLADLIAEVYGYKVIRRIIWMGLACEFIFIFVCWVLIHLPSPSYWHHQQAYEFVFSRLPRVFVGSFLGVVVGSFLNAYILIRWKILTMGKLFVVRSFFSSLTGEILFTIIVILTNYLGVYGFSHLVELACTSILFKSIMSILYTTPGFVLSDLLKKYEGIDIFDYDSNFNPFKLG